MDINKALDSLSTIKAQIEQGHQYRGFSAAILVATAVFALLLSIWQSSLAVLTLQDYTMHWVVAGSFCTLFLSVEAMRRARLKHGKSGLDRSANVMRAMLPVLAAGGLLSVIAMYQQLELLPYLPGLWQVLISIGTFAISRMLPKGMEFVAFWYMLSGLTAVALAPSDMPNLLFMPIGFCTGQLLSAFIIHKGASNER